VGRTVKCTLATRQGRRRKAMEFADAAEVVSELQLTVPAAVAAVTAIRQRPTPLHRPRVGGAATIG